MKIIEVWEFVYDEYVHSKHLNGIVNHRDTNVLFVLFQSLGFLPAAGYEYVSREIVLCFFNWKKILINDLGESRKNQSFLFTPVLHEK